MKDSIIRFFKTFINLIRYIISVCIVVLIFGLSYQILSDTYLNKEIEYDGESFHNLPENSIDVFVLGSSHAQYSFCPSFFYEETGLYSYVLGSGGQPLEVSYEMLKEGLKTQSPKLVILEVYEALPLKNVAEGDYNYVIAEYQMTGQEKYNTINYLSEEKRKQYLNDFIITHNDWKDDWIKIDKIIDVFNNLKNKLMGVKELDYSKIDSIMGYRINYPQYPVDNYWYPYNTHDYLDVELMELAQKSLDNIYNLCKEKGIDILLYKTPIDSLDQENISYLHKVWEWADSKGIPYIDFVELAPEIDFNMWLQSDSFHSYVNGASMITTFLADQVKEKFVFDHADNEILSAKYKQSSGWITKECLNYECNPLKYYDRLEKYSNLKLVKYSSASITPATQNLLDSLGIDSSSNYYGIYDNGLLIEGNQQGIDTYYLDHHIVINNDTILFDDQEVYKEGGELIFVIFDYDLSNYKVKSTNAVDVWEWNTSFYGS